MVAGRRVASAPPRLSHIDKLAILQELEQECTHARGISTDLAAEAGQHTKPVVVPAEYQQHAQVFSKEESHQFPPRVPGTMPSTSSLGRRNPSTARCKPPRPGNGPTSADGSTTCWPEGTSNTQTQTRLTSPLPSSTSRRRMARTGQSKTIEKRTH
jgi:hypothetical protein